MMPETESWKTALSQAVTHPKQLLERLQLDSTLLDEAMQQAASHFRVFATESYLKRIEVGNIHDPLLQQILPLGKELEHHAHFSLDPLQEKQANVLPGLLHKYHGRALLITNGHCAINCRFCFRRNFPYQENHFNTFNKTAIFDYLASDTSIEELILSGGDPLLLNDNTLREIIENTEAITHIKRLRIHSRVPIVLPERITEPLMHLLRNNRLSVIVVLHCNHAQEIDTAVEQAIQKLRSTCHTLLNQSVLLKGVNDSADTQIALQKRLFECGVQPYYLHLLDKVQGTAHFDLEEEHAKAIYREMEARLPGYLLPKLVREVAGIGHKLQIRAETP